MAAAKMYRVNILLHNVSSRYTQPNSTARSPVYILWLVYRQRRDVGQYIYARTYTRFVYIGEGTRARFGPSECGTMQLEVEVEMEVTDCTRRYIGQAVGTYSHPIRPDATHLLVFESMHPLQHLVQWKIADSLGAVNPAN